MIKLFVKIALVAVILFVIGRFASSMLTGKSPVFVLPQVSLPEISLSEITESLTDNIEPVTKESSEKQTDNIYKWTDEKGVIYYTSEKPRGDSDFETITFNRETNVMPSVKDKPSAKQDTTSTTSNHTESIIPNNLYSPSGIKQIIEQAKNVQDLVNDQYEMTENTVDNQ